MTYVSNEVLVTGEPYTPGLSRFHVAAQFGFKPSEVVKLGSATSDTESKAGHRLTVNASQPHGGAHRHALSEGGENFNLLVAGENVHGEAHPSRCEGDGPQRLWKTRSPKRIFSGTVVASGSSPVR